MFEITNNKLIKINNQSEQTSIIIPDGIIEIADEVFLHPQTVKSLFLPSSIKIIGKHAFRGCLNIEEIVVDEYNEQYFSIDGVVYTKNIEMLVFYPPGKRKKEYEIPKTVKIVPDFALEGSNIKIYTIHAPTTKFYCDLNDKIIKLMFDASFFDFKIYAKRYPNITYDLRVNSLKIINDIKLKKKSLLCFMDNLNEGDFYIDEVYEENIRYVLLNKRKYLINDFNDRVIMTFMFKNKMISLEEALELEKNIDQFSVEIKGLFIRYLSQFSDEEKDELLEKELFTDYTTATELKKIWNYKKISDDKIILVSMKKQISHVVIPSKIGKFVVEELSDSLFKNNKNIVSVNFLEKNIKIPSTFFFGCTSLRSVILPAEITEVENYTFYNCTELVDVLLPDSVTKIGERAFYNCKKIKEIILPKNVTKIGEYAFYGCENLEVIELSDKIRKIHNSTFEGCISLKKIDIPKSVKSIAYKCFCNCKSLTEVNFFKGTIIDSNAFYGCEKLKIH